MKGEIKKKTIKRKRRGRETLVDPEQNYINHHGHSQAHRSKKTMSV